MEDPRRFYTYAYLREDRTPYYIGKGKGNRAFIKNRKGIRPPKDQSRIIFLKQNLTEEEAFKYEMYMIAVFGRKDLGTGILRNKTDGGEGNSGAIRSEETRRKQSEVHKGKKHSEEHRRKNSETKRGENHPFYGKKHSEETRKRLSEANKGENHPLYGKSHSEETRRKQSEAKKGENHYFYGKSHSKETRRKQSEANKGKKWWNDGKGNTKFAKECPGKNWVPGRGKKKLRDT